MTNKVATSELLLDVFHNSCNKLVRLSFANLIFPIYLSKNKNVLKNKDP